MLEDEKPAGSKDTLSEAWRGRAQSRQIPKLDHIPLTRREKTMIRVRRVIYIVVALTIIVLTTLLVLHLRHVAAVEDATLAADAEGTPGSVAAALDLLEGDDDPEARALRARLLAAQALEGVEGRAAEAQALLEGVDAEAAGATDRRIAAGYLALAKGEPARAAREVSPLRPAGTYAAEQARARALASIAVGNREHAAAAARVALRARPDAPRYVAMSAQVIARHDVPLALKRLDSLRDRARLPVARLARARILMDARRDIPAAIEAARAVIEDEQSTPREKAWARLVEATALADDGRLGEARAKADEAAAAPPPGDEQFRMALAEVYLRAGAVRSAEAIVGELGMGISADPGRRIQLRTELAIARHEVGSARAWVKRLPGGTRSALLRARLDQLRGNWEPARRAYRQAQRGPAERRPAILGLAAVDLEEGRPAEALAALAPLLRESPHHPEAVALAASAHLARNDADAASAIIEPALRARPGSGPLLGARAHVHMVREQWEPALASLREALEQMPDDADLGADRADVASRLGHGDEARAAYEAALAVRPEHAGALLGLLRLDIDEERADHAEELLGRVDAAGIQSQDVDRLRARYLVLTMAGWPGAQRVRDLVRRNRDAVLYEALGHLYLQAEMFVPASDAFERASERNNGELETLLYMAISQCRGRLPGPGFATLERVAQRIGEAGEPPPEIRALRLSAQARYEWVQRNELQAVRLARQAIEIDPRAGEAQLILADQATDSEQDATPFLRAAAESRRPLPLARARMALRTETWGEQECAWAQHYRRVAGAVGAYAQDIRQRIRACD